MTFGHASLPKLVGDNCVKTVEVQTEYLEYFTRKQDHALDMLFTRQKARAVANPEPPAGTPTGTNIYVKYALPDGHSSHKSTINYSFNKFFNTLRKRRVMNCIIFFLV